MLFSSIDEAWHVPKTMEKFSINNNNTYTSQQECDELIQKLLSCDGCYQKLLSRSGVVSTSPKELEFINNIYQKYIVNLSPKLREKLYNLLTIIAVVLVVLILQ